MSKKYRVTPKNDKWIIQCVETRKTVSAKPFIKKSDAEDAMFAMSGSDQKVEKVYLSNKHSNNLLHGSYHLKQKATELIIILCKDTTQSTD